MTELWKPLITKNSEFLGRYEISNKGQVKRLAMSYDRYNHKEEIYISYRSEKMIKTRKYKTSELKFCSITMTFIDDHGEQKKISESVYINKAITETFKPKK